MVGQVQLGLAHDRVAEHVVVHDLGIRQQLRLHATDGRHAQVHGRERAARGQVVALVHDLLHELNAAAHDVHDLVRDIARDAQRAVEIGARDILLGPAPVKRLARAQLLVDLKDHVVGHLAQLLCRFLQRRVIRAQRAHGQRPHRRRQRRHDRADTARLRQAVRVRHRSHIVLDRHGAEGLLRLVLSDGDHVVTVRRVDQDLFLLFRHKCLHSPRA